MSSVYTERITVEIEGRKKPNSAMTCMTQLPMKLQWDSNMKIIQWCDIDIDRISDGVTVGKSIGNI
jgi:hypothetical protein